MALNYDSFRELQPIEEVALDTVVSVMNRAKEQLGQRETLKGLARCRELFAGMTNVKITRIKPPLAITAEQIISDTIRFHWRLTDLFMFCIKYKHTSDDETSHYYYYEVIFSQPSAKYPIPQATVKVFFRVEEKYTHPPINAPVSEIHFRLEGHRTSHDIRYVTLLPEWLLAIIKMKLTLFKRIEEYNVF